MPALQLLLGLPLDPPPPWAEILLTRDASFDEEGAMPDEVDDPPSSRPGHLQKPGRALEHPCVPAYDAKRRTSLCLNCGEILSRCAGARVTL